MNRVERSRKPDMIGLVLGAAVLTLGCGPRMAVPTDFPDGKVEYETDGRSGEATEGEDAEFAFGPYNVSSVERNLTLDEFDYLDEFEPAAKRGFSYLVAGGGKTKLRGQCAERAPKENKALDGTVTVVDEEPPLACMCQAAGQTVTQLFVEDLAGEYNGPLLAGDVQARVVGIYNLENGDLIKGRPLGYRIEDPDGTVAGASVIPGESQVWLRKNLDEPGASNIACALAGLMLWVPPERAAPEEE